MKSGKRQKRLSRLLVNWNPAACWCVIWTIPTMGIFISSFRNRDDIATSGWWKVFPHREWQAGQGRSIPRRWAWIPTESCRSKGPPERSRSSAQGIETPDGKRVTWIGNKRLGRVEMQEQVWTVIWDFTLDNYKQVLGGQDFTFTHAGWHRWRWFPATTWSGHS